VKKWVGMGGCGRYCGIVGGGGLRGGGGVCFTVGECVRLGWGGGRAKSVVGWGR